MSITVLLLSADPDLEPLYRDLLADAGYRVETAALPATTQQAATPHGSDPEHSVATSPANNHTEPPDVAVLFAPLAAATEAATAVRRNGINTMLVATPAKGPGAPTPAADAAATDPVVIAHAYDQLWQAGVAELLVTPTPSELLRAIEDAAGTDGTQLASRHRNLGVASATEAASGTDVSASATEATSDTEVSASAETDHDV